MEEVSTMDNDFKLPDVKVIQIFTSLSQSMDWGLQQMGIPEIWKTDQGEGQTCLVIDTGMPNHPDLNENIIKELCVDFTGEGLEDLNGHSTFVCSIIAAKNDENGVVGYAPKAKIITAKVLDSTGSGSGINVEAALLYALEISDKISVVNMSLGSPRPQSSKMQTIIQELVKRGIVVVCAAGNEQNGKTGQTICYPAKYPEVIAVAAYDKNGNIARFSSWGAEVDFSFPGVDNIGCGLDGTYVKMSGTSFASPACAACIMLMKCKHLMKNPAENLTVEQVKEHLSRHSIDKGDKGRDVKWGYGIVNVKELLLEE